MNNRQFHRITFHHPAQLSASTGTWATQILDLSLHGALLSCPPSFQHVEKDSALVLQFYLGNNDEAVELSGRLAHQTSGQLGMEFVTLSLESMTQLRQVISYNLGDEALLQRDFSALISQH